MLFNVRSTTLHDISPSIPLTYLLLGVSRQDSPVAHTQHCGLLSYLRYFISKCIVLTFKRLILTSDISKRQGAVFQVFVVVVS